MGMDVVAVEGIVPAAVLGWRPHRAEVVMQQTRQGRDELLREWWGEAAERWLAAKGASSENTHRAYEAAVRMFFGGCDVEAWEVGAAQVVAWQGHMRERGLAETTINLRLAALSSFYAFAARYEVVDPATGRVTPLTSYNPVDRVEREKVIPYGKAVHLSVDEVRALLRSIPQDTVYGLRDYALVITYFYTGRRSSEIRCLRWGDISRDDGRMWYVWEGKGKRRTDELPLPAHRAIVAYLRAAGRYDGIGDDDYIFTALSAVAERLPNVEEQPQDQPLHSSMINKIVKKCARRAGLKWERIHTHTLRHTAAMLRYRLSGDVKELKDFLNHSTLTTTQIYLDHNERRTDTLWAQVEALIGMEDGAGQGAEGSAGEV